MNFFPETVEIKKSMWYMQFVTATLQRYVDASPQT
jgi:hypothetical protein